MKHLNSLAHQRKPQKVSVSSVLQKPVKVSFSLALTKPNSPPSENCASDEPIIRKKKMRIRRDKVPVKSHAIPSTSKKESKSQTPEIQTPQKRNKSQKDRRITPQNENSPRKEDKKQTTKKEGKTQPREVTSQKESQAHHPPPAQGPSASNAPNAAERKRRVNFGNVEVFKFAFSQGHDTVPAKGGVSLGMENTHHARHLFQLCEYAKYCKAEKVTKLSRWRAAARQVAKQKTQKPTKRKATFSASGKPPKRPKYADKAIEMSTSSSETEGEESDEEMFEQCHVYEPMRRALLANCGVTIEENVADESLHVSETRAHCGCRCEGQKCVPENCECALGGIQCQVDYLDESVPSNSFPCSCSASSCANPEGRIELDPLRIRNHFLQTLMRLKAAKKKGMDESGEVSSPQHILFKEEDSTSDEDDGKESKKEKDTLTISPTTERAQKQRKWGGRRGHKSDGGEKINREDKGTIVGALFDGTKRRTKKEQSDGK